MSWRAQKPIQQPFAMFPSLTPKPQIQNKQQLITNTWAEYQQLSIRIVGQPTIINNYK